MAMMDDRAFLVSHIRNSFITSDDTGMCEVILAAEDFDKTSDKQPATWHPSLLDGTSPAGDNSQDLDVELPHSYDIMADMDFASFRRRSNTAQRLEKLKREKQKQSKIKHIPWKNVQHSATEVGEHFEKKEVEKNAEAKKSLLSLKLEEMKEVPENPFTEYVKFDGRGGGGLHTKKIDIYLTMASEADRAYPMTVVTLATAKVSDLIGLICWQYTMEQRKPPLSERLDIFALHIAEDDGEVDMDFPALDNREPISKFGFTKLALVAKEPPKNLSMAKIMVNIDMQHRGQNQLSLENSSILMKDILDQLLSETNLKQRPGLEYHLEKKLDRAIADLAQPLATMGTTDFVLVRENSALRDGEDEQQPHSEMAESLCSPQYKSFFVNMIFKLRSNREVQLGVSGDKIEVDPMSGKGLFGASAKPVSLDIESIAACSITDKKSSGKTVFRLVFSVGQEFKHYDFQCDVTKANQIVQKINNIIEMRSSPVRKDYKAHKVRKLKRHSVRG